MKTETKIAQEYIKRSKELDFKEGKGFHSIINLSFLTAHKASCQRFLEFLEEMPDSVKGLNHFVKNQLVELCGKDLVRHIQEKITDLKNAIKKYDEAGI